MWLKLEYWSKGNDHMKLVERVLLVALAILVVHNLHGKVFPAKAMSGYEDSLAIMWEVLDADKDGGISVSEFKAVDADSDGLLSLDELLDYTNKHNDDVEADLQQDDANIEGTYEIYLHPEIQLFYDKFILDLTRDGNGEYSVTLSAGDQSIDGTKVKVSGKKLTFITSQSDDFIQLWQCTMNEGELSVQLSTQPIHSSPPYKGKLVVETDLQRDDTNIEGKYEIYSLYPVDQEDITILELTRGDDGDYSVKMTTEDHTFIGSNVIVSGNKCAFTITADNESLTWECTFNDRELSAQFTVPDYANTYTVIMEGKLFVAE